MPTNRSLIRISGPGGAPPKAPESLKRAKGPDASAATRRVRDVVQETRASVRILDGLAAAPASFSHGERAEIRAFTDGLDRLADRRGATGRAAPVGGAPETSAQDAGAFSRS